MRNNNTNFFYEDPNSINILIVISRLNLEN